MPRALAVARVTVPPERESAYLAGAAELAAALRARGQHLWIFRRPSAPGQFLEFREGPEAATHVASAPTAPEARLAAALQALAQYEPGAEELWLEVPLPADRPA
ncbi:MAG TPA: hypothetical protein VFV65_06885 [Gemmatimonadales bacterium]|nr:hypothetical protein [Gemmatimonadales bacterium]